MRVEVKQTKDDVFEDVVSSDSLRRRVCRTLKEATTVGQSYLC